MRIVLERVATLHDVSASARLLSYQDVQWCRVIFDGGPDYVAFMISTDDKLRFSQQWLGEHVRRSWAANGVFSAGQLEKIQLVTAVTWDYTLLVADQLTPGYEDDPR